MRFKKKMTFEEMAEHMSQNSFKQVNRVNVGKYAKMHGYRVYKPMINCRIMFFYINEKIKDDEE